MINTNKHQRINDGRQTLICFLGPVVVVVVVVVIILSVNKQTNRLQKKNIYIDNDNDTIYDRI